MINIRNINTYEIQMELTGRVTQLPDSQKLFGALVYLYSEYASSTKASVFVSQIKMKEIYCAVSDMLPQGYLPLPSSYLIERTKKLTDREAVKQIYNEIKKREYIKREMLSEVFENPESIKKLYPYVSLRQSQQIHAAIESLYYQMDGLNPNLYSVPEIAVVEVEGESKQEKQITRFSFYLSLEEGEIEKEFRQMLSAAQQCDKLFFLGARASQGLNTYKICQILETELCPDENSECYLNLGMLLPDGIDFEQSYLDIYTSERRPYHAPGGWDDSQDKVFVSYIKPGSVLFLTEDRKKAGRSISSPFDKRAIVFGNPVFYPIEKGTGGR